MELAEAEYSPEELKLFEVYLSQYSLCIGPCGRVEAVGRAACMMLITLANAIEPDVRHGDLEAGYLDMDAIRALWRKAYDAVHLVKG